MKRCFYFGAGALMIAAWAISLMFNAGIFVQYGPMPTSISVGVRDANVVFFWGNSGNLYATAGDEHQLGPIGIGWASNSWHDPKWIPDWEHYDRTSPTGAAAWHQRLNFSAHYLLIAAIGWIAVVKLRSKREPRAGR